MYLLALAIVLAIPVQVYGSPSQINSLRIPTTSGEVAGFINSTVAPHVAQFLGIQYAEHPTGNLRFSPPVPKSPNLGLFKATKLGPSCPQYNTSIPTFFSVAAPEYYIEGPMAEECLSLNIWTPMLALSSHRKDLKDPSRENDRGQQIKKLPVIIFIHGGQFTVGGSRVAYHLPDRWVERSQRHIVVTIKFVHISTFMLRLP
jgi:carboxylesterase type B